MTFNIDKMYVDCIHKDRIAFNRIVKYSRKKDLSNHFYIPKENESFFKWLLSNVNSKSKYKHLGYINDNVYIVHNPTNLPQAPENWDILCVNGEILQYDFSDKDNNIYWVRSTLKNSNTFIINSDRILEILTTMQIVSRSVDQERSFFEVLSEKLKTFVITQYFFTENYTNSIEKDKTNSKNKDYTNYHKLNSDLMNNVIDTAPVKSLDFAPPDYALTGFPKISFIIPLSSYANFHHNFLLLSQLNYLNYEIIVIDYLNYENNVKHLLKLHANKVRFIEINPVDYSKKYGDLKNKKIPLGFMLNSAVKSSQGDIIFPFFPDKHYNIENVEFLVKNYLFSNKECFIGKNLKNYNIKDGLVYDSLENFSFSNMFFSQKFWLTYTFDESCDDEKTLVYRFIKDRLNTVNFYESSNWCYNVISSDSISDGKKIDFSDIHLNSLNVFIL